MKPQRLLLPFPTQRKPRPRKLKRPAKDSPICENMLNRRMWIDMGRQHSNFIGSYETLAPRQCTHRGLTYKLNGLLTMVLCICCARKIMRKANVTLRLVRSKNVER